MNLRPVLGALTALLVAGGTAWATPRAFEHSTKPWLNRSVVKSRTETRATLQWTTTAMECPKCKSVTGLVRRDLGTKSGHGYKMVAVSRHQCPECRNELLRKQASKDVAWVHTCRDCGSTSVNCCATTSPKTPTRGMI